MRISSKVQPTFDALPKHLQSKVLAFLEDNPREFIESRYDLVNAVLIYEGIIDYTDFIIELVQEVFDYENH